MRIGILTVFVAFAACPSPSTSTDGGSGGGSAAGGGSSTDAGLPCAGWTQWGHDSAHSGQACASGQALTKALGVFVFDPFTAQEMAEAQGNLVSHFQSPLILGSDVYMELKGGRYVSCEELAVNVRGLPDGGLCGSNAWNLMTWNEAHFTWANGALTQDWTFASDWKPVPVALAQWEPVFHPALFGELMYVPGVGGTVHKVNRHTGAKLSTINPQLALDGGTSVDPDTYVSGPLTIDPAGNVIFNVLRLDPLAPATQDASGWLVRIAPDDSVKAVSYSALVPSAPAATDACPVRFTRPAYLLPYPPVNPDGGGFYPTAMAPCGSQRPGVNIAPAIGPDGTIYTLSRAHLANLTSYLVAVNPDLSPKWASSMRTALHDGCGVTMLSDAVCPQPVKAQRSALHCCKNAALGVDPATNQQPAGVVDDSSSSNPVVLPDGSILYGAITIYNETRGHLFKFSSGGLVTDTWDFGWDMTPAYTPHGGSYSIITKNNHYYSNYDVTVSGPFYITRLSPSLMIESSFASTNTQDCVREDDGGVTCADQTCTPDTDGGQLCSPSHPNGFEWCVNAPAVDPDGVTFANSEDGRVYAIKPDGTLRDSVFLFQALGAAYTPISVDGAGRVYSLNRGTMTVVGQ